MAQLVIEHQVLHSYDTPRRKDLGYSIVIGLILFGVAATLSQTIGFSPVLLLFLGVALPTLVLYYRSRLALRALTREGLDKKNFTSPNFKVLIVNFLLISGLCPGIFSVFPRFSGYKLRYFPVSAPIDVNGDFTGCNIFTGRYINNPGYVRQGNGKDDGNGTGQGRSSELGKVDYNFHYGFNSEMNQNLRGEMKPKVVMWIRS